jgi:hypothetical protein
LTWGKAPALTAKPVRWKNNYSEGKEIYADAMKAEGAVS